MPTSSALQLRYLFGAHFSDGSEYFQTEEDVSPSDPRRSAFYDLCQHDENGDSLQTKICGRDISVTRDDIEIFQLAEPIDNGPDSALGNTFLVDLRDGHFEINGAPFYIQIPLPNQPLQLVYFRRRREHQNVTYSTGTGQVLSAVDAGGECEYHMGWRYRDKPELPPVTLILG